MIPLYEQYGLEILCKYLDAEFALVLYDNKTKQLVAARDPMGIRPMFYGYSKKEHQICFASEAKTYLIYVMILCLFHQDIII